MKVHIWPWPREIWVTFKKIKQCPPKVFAGLTQSKWKVLYIKSFKSVYFGLHTVHNNTSICSFPLPFNDFQHPGGHTGDHVLQELALLGPVKPHLQDCLLPLLEVGAVLVLQLLLHLRPDGLDVIEVGGSCWATSPTGRGASGGTRPSQSFTGGRGPRPGENGWCHADPWRIPACHQAVCCIWHHSSFPLSWGTPAPLSPSSWSSPTPSPSEDASWSSLWTLGQSSLSLWASCTGSPGSQTQFKMALIREHFALPILHPPQFNCSLANASLCSLICSVRMGFFAFFLEGS